MYDGKGGCLEFVEVVILLFILIFIDKSWLIVVFMSLLLVCKIVLIIFWLRVGNMCLKLFIVLLNFSCFGWLFGCFVVCGFLGGWCI